jgi:hypothetical protein
MMSPSKGALMINTHSSGRVWEGLMPIPALEGSGVLVAEAQRGNSGVDIQFPNRALWFGSATLPLYRQGSTRRNSGLSSQARSDERLPGGAPGFVSGCPTTSKDVHLCPPKSRCTVALTQARREDSRVESGGAIGASVLLLPVIPEASEHTPGHYQCQEIPLDSQRFFTQHGNPQRYPHL